MPERWERRLERLREVEAPASIEVRTSEGPRNPSPSPGNRGRVVAAVVAFAVFAAAAAFAWRAFDTRTGSTTGRTSGEPPRLSVTLESNGEHIDGDHLRVDTQIVYGDTRKRSFTSTTPDHAIVEWVGAADLDAFEWPLVVGSGVDISSDGSDPRVLVGAPQDWPDFVRFQRIDRLPPTAGDYVLVFRADYPEGVATVALRVHLTEPGALSPSDAADVGRIVCEANGSTTVVTPDVLAQPDGVHLVVVSHLDEPASINGLGFDVDPGRSEWIAGTPGVHEVACWPFSDHRQDPPQTTSLSVVDPEGFFVDGTLECVPEDDGTALDIGIFPSSGGDEAGSITAEIARPLIGGIRPQDDIIVPGFRDSVHHTVVVVRDGRRIANVGFVYRDGGWVQRGGMVCGGGSVVA
jgi:hypothetical protein